MHLGEMKMTKFDCEKYVVKKPAYEVVPKFEVKGRIPAMTLMSGNLVPGTKMYEECLNNNYIKKNYSSSLYEESVLELPTITHEELQSGFREFQLLSDEIRLAHEKAGDGIFLADI